jgi:carboxyl-terminal processing protease
LIGLVDQALHGPEGQIARLTLLDPDGQFRELAVAREDDDAAAVAIGNLPRLRVRTDARTLRTPAGREVGVIGFNAWMPVVAGPFAEAIDAHRSADGLVIDLRGNPGGLAEMIRGLSGHIVAEPVLIGRIAMRGVELEIRANPRRSTPDGRRVEPFAGPVAVLIDEMSGSASECFAGGLQSLGRVRVFGRPSMGQALPAATRALPSGDVLMYAVGDFITSTGERLEGAGVMPDEFVALSIDDLAAGRDVTLEAALGWIDDLRAASAAGG